MTSYTWSSGVSGDWGTSADWLPNGIPDAIDAAAVITATGTHYTVTIASGESEIVNSFTLGNLSGGTLASAPTLEIAGTLAFGGSSAKSSLYQGTIVVDASGVIEGAGQLGAQSTSSFSFTNNGTLIANAGTNSNLYVSVPFTNSGTLLADNGSLWIEGSSFGNYSGNTLTGGTYIVQGPSVGADNQIGFAVGGVNGATDIVTDAANVVLDGGATEIQAYDGSFQTLEQQLQTIASVGSLQLLDGRGYLTSNAITDNGLLNLQGGSLASGGLSIGSEGVFQGYGVVSGSVTDNGAIVANGGALYIPGAIGGAGSFTIDAGSSLSLAGATPTAVANNGVVFDTSGLLNVSSLTGSGTLEVQSGGTLSLSAATSQTIVFAGSNVAVTLGTPLLYSGTLVGFGLGDTLVLDGVIATSATVVNSNTLAIMSGGVTVDTVALSGNYSGAHFSATTVGGSAVITNTSGAPARDDMPFTISVNNSDGLSAAQETAIVNDLSAAALDWAQYVTGHAPLRIQLNITSGGSSSELANGGFTSSVASGEVINGETVVVPSSIYALTTGNYISGTTADVVVNLPLSSGELNSPGGLSTSAPDPSNEYDLFSVFSHEIAHGLGFGGLTQQNGALGSDETLFDAYTQDTVINGTITAAYFVGPDAEAAYGAFLGTGTATPVPLTLLNNGENFAHVANHSSDPLAQDLMSGIGIGPGQSRDISSVDLAMLQDVGLPVTAPVLCFLRGTFIATPSGEVPIETLAVGDVVLTRTGVARPIVWVGVGKVLATRGHRNAATPVIVRKGAIADNVPHHDLRLTKAHALYFGGALVPVEYLVNHRSILWDDHAQEVELFHIELETHDVLLANAALAESYRDDGNRWLFRNANTGWHLPPKPPCAPVVTGGAFVDELWWRLLDRAGKRPGMTLTDDPDLHLRADGVRIGAVSRHGTSYVFALPNAPMDLRIASRSAVPCELGLARDSRQLGVGVRRIALRQGNRFRVIEADDPVLATGFHAHEAADGFRWTDGDATIPATALAAFNGALEVVLLLGCSTSYPSNGDVRSRAA